MVKGFMHCTTGQCELMRICYQTLPGAERSIKIEESLCRSRCDAIIKIETTIGGLAKQARFNTSNLSEVEQLLDYAVDAICMAKKVSTKIHPKFWDDMRISLVHVYGYRELIAEAEALRKEKFSSDNPRHERLLVELWKALKPTEPLTSRKSKQWQDIGFQGNDPATDFRGMGLLGLEQLVYFATRYPDTARSILSHSMHPGNGYPFACTGINLTDLVWKLLNGGDLRTHFFNKYDHEAFIMEDLHYVYCYIFFAFDELWQKLKPNDVMEFSYVYQLFAQKLREVLTDYTTVLTFKPIETI